MNKLRKWFIGDLLLATEEKQEKLKIELLFNVAAVFAITVFLSVPTSFIYVNIILAATAIISTFVYASVLFLIKKMQSIKVPTIFFCSAYMFFQIINLYACNGEIQLSLTIFMLGIALLAYYILGLKWGLCFLGTFSIIICSFLYLKAVAFPFPAYNIVATSDLIGGIFTLISIGYLSYIVLFYDRLQKTLLQNHVESLNEAQQLNNRLLNKQAAVGRLNAYQEGILNSGDMSVWAIDRNYNFLFFNDYHKRLTKHFFNKTIQIEQNITDFSPITGTIESDKKTYARVFNGESFTLEKRVTVANITYEGEYHFSPIIIENQIVGAVVKARDITQRKKSELTLLEQKKLLTGISDVAVALLSSSKIDKSIVKALSLTGTMAAVDRVYIFEYHPSKNEPSTYCYSQRYEWTKNDTATQIDNPQLQNIPIAGTSYETVFKLLEKGQTMNELVKNLTGDIQTLLLSQNIQSILLVPINIDNKHWGFIGFDDCQQEHIWTTSEIATLRSIGSMIGTQIARKHTQQALKQSQVKLTEAQQIAHIGSWELDIASQQMKWSSTMFELYKMPTNSNAPTFNEYLQKVHPEDKETLIAAIEVATALVQPFELEIRNILPEGRTHYAILKGRVLKEDKQVVKLFGTIQDIDDRKKIELENQLLTFAMKQSADGLALLNEQQKFTYVNDAYLKLFGFNEAEELIGKTWTTVYQKKQISIFENDIFPIFLKTGHYVGEALGIAKNNQIISHDLTLTALTNGNLLCFCRNNSQRKNQEKQLIEANQTLEQKVTLRTSELKKSNSELALSNKYLDNFVYTAAHDLRSPILNLKRLVSFFERIPDEQKKAELTQRIVNSVLQLEGTLNGLIKIIDVQKNEQLDSQELFFQTIVTNLKSILELEITKSNAVITTNFKTCESIYYNEAYLNSILQNLITNAIKYRSPKRALNIKINTEKTSSFVLLTVQDNSIGMDLAQYGHKLFQPFQRLTNQGKGKGIGLNIIKTMVEKNKGKITVESTLGVGTIFKVYLKPYES